jgi:hypothetical protein
MGKAADLLGRRPKIRLARPGRGLLQSLVRPNVARWVGARCRSPRAPGAGRGVSAASLPGDGAVVAFGNYTSPSSSSTSMASMSELIVVVSANIANLVHFPSSSSPPRPGPRPGRRVSSPRSAACVATRRPWTEPCVTRWEPRCHSLPSSRRRSHRREEEVVLPTRLPRREPCSCTNPRRATVPGTSRCLRGAAKQDINISAEPRRVLKEPQIVEMLMSRTHWVGRVVHPLAL